MIFRGKSGVLKKYLDLKQQKIVFYLLSLIFINKSEHYPKWKKNLYIFYYTIRWYVKVVGQHRAFINIVKTHLQRWNNIKQLSTRNGYKTFQQMKNDMNIHSENSRTGESAPQYWNPRKIFIYQNFVFSFILCIIYY